MATTCEAVSCMSPATVLSDPLCSSAAAASALLHSPGSAMLRVISSTHDSAVETCSCTTVSERSFSSRSAASRSSASRRSASARRADTNASSSWPRTVYAASVIAARKIHRGHAVDRDVPGVGRLRDHRGDAGHQGEQVDHLVGAVQGEAAPQAAQPSAGSP